MASRFRSLFSVVALVFWSRLALAAIKSSEDSSKISISNDRLAFVLTKSSGSITSITLDGQSLLGSGTGLYLDCHCVPGQWVPGSGGTTKLFTGTDSTGKAYAGAVSSGNYQNTGKILEQYWFLRDGETGLHSFSRAQYKGSGSGGDLGEMRVLFRPTSTLWTHLSSSDGMYSTIPSTSGQPEVQDATWQIKSSDTYASQMSNYFTKYMYSETWRDQKVHGMFADGTKSSDGSTFGAWLVMNTKDTYFNGPTHSDLTVDGIVYNYVGK